MFPSHCQVFLDVLQSNLGGDGGGDSDDLGDEDEDGGALCLYILVSTTVWCWVTSRDKTRLLHYSKESPVNLTRQLVGFNTAAPPIHLNQAASHREIRQLVYQSQLYLSFTQSIWLTPTSSVFVIYTIHSMHNVSVMLFGIFIPSSKNQNKKVPSSTWQPFHVWWEVPDVSALLTIPKCSELWIVIDLFSLSPQHLFGQ